MEGYSADGEFRDSEGQTWSQNSEWMKYGAPFSSPNNVAPSPIPQVQLQHGPNLFASRSSAFISTSAPLHRRLPHSDRELEDIATEIPTSQSTIGVEILEVKQEEAAAKASKPVPRKRGRPTKEKASIKEKPQKKGKKTVIELGESDEEEATPSKWRDFETETLIAIRGEMDDEFARTANKQGMNTWIKLQARMVAGIRGFNRTWLSCKKKYKIILTEYRNDKRANEISGTDRKQECRWFDEMDIWNSGRASVYNQIPASAMEGDEPLTTPSTPSTPSTPPVSAQINPSTAPTTLEKKKKKTQDQIEGLLQQVVGNSTTLISTFQQSTNLLKNMDRNFAALLERF